MNIKIYIFFCLLIGFLGKTQVKPMAIPADPGLQAIVFKYDDAGNQIYRGYAVSGKQAQEPEDPMMNIELVPIQNDQEFWDQLQIYPVPVKNILTIVWSDKVDNLINEVSIYEQNSAHWKFQQKNLPNLNKQVQIDMTLYYMGVYVLTFQLKDGRTVSKNITKF